MSNLKRNINGIFIKRTHEGRYILECLVCPSQDNDLFIINASSEKAGYELMNSHFDAIHSSQNPNNKSEAQSGN